MAVMIFMGFVIFVLALSFYLGSKAKSASGYFTAGGQIHWAVNGIAFAGDYLSAASFLGICGMIAFYGYDGFLYSIGYLAGWMVALFVVAEPMKRLGKYTFTDALDAKFNHRGIQLAAGISTLIVSLFYLIPQMVGAGALVMPLLHMPHHWGVIMVGVIVITIVATAGMASTTYVQFLKGGLLIIFSLVIAICVCYRGLTTTPTSVDDDGNTIAYYAWRTQDVSENKAGTLVYDAGFTFVEQKDIANPKDKTQVTTFVKLIERVAIEGRIKAEINSRDAQITGDAESLNYTSMGREHTITGDALSKVNELLNKDKKDIISLGGRNYVHKEINGEKVLVLHDGSSTVIDGLRVVEHDGKLYAEIENWWMKITGDDGKMAIQECQSKFTRPNGAVMINGVPASEDHQLMPVGALTKIKGETNPEKKSLGLFSFLSDLSHKDTEFRTWKKQKLDYDDNLLMVYYPVARSGKDTMTPGQYFKVKTPLQKLDFISLMLALFLGTAALPHILIRYYTVSSPAAARKSTIVAIAAIGFFYILTMYLGLGAAVNNVLNLESSNMSAPLLAKTFGTVIFAVISAIAFATVLGTVSGLIVASSGAVAHDLLDRYCGLNMTDKQKVGVGKLAAVLVGFLAIILGIVFKGVNVTFLVGLAFAVAASANLPSILMLLFWKKTTAQGIVASIVVGIVSAVGLILFSPVMYELYGLEAASAPIPLKSPGIISIPLSFLTLIVVSLMTQKNAQVANVDISD